MKAGTTRDLGHDYIVSLETRLAALEAESAIRKLKYIYLNACDSKDVETIKACFTEDAELDYPPIGKFGLDGLIDIFTQMAATTPITDVHQIHYSANLRFRCNIYLPTVHHT